MEEWMRPEYGRQVGQRAARCEQYAGAGHSMTLPPDLRDYVAHRIFGQQMGTVPAPADQRFRLREVERLRRMIGLLGAGNRSVGGYDPAPFEYDRLGGR